MSMETSKSWLIILLLVMSSQRMTEGHHTEFTVIQSAVLYTLCLKTGSSNSVWVIKEIAWLWEDDQHDYTHSYWSWENPDVTQSNQLAVFLPIWPHTFVNVWGLTKVNFVSPRNHTSTKEQSLQQTLLSWVGPHHVWHIAVWENTNMSHCASVAICQEWQCPNRTVHRSKLCDKNTNREKMNTVFCITLNGAIQDCMFKHVLYWVLLSSFCSQQRQIVCLLLSYPFPKRK